MVFIFWWIHRHETHKSFIKIKFTRKFAFVNIKNGQRWTHHKRRSAYHRDNNCMQSKVFFVQIALFPQKWKPTQMSFLVTWNEWADRWMINCDDDDDDEFVIPILTKPAQINIHGFPRWVYVGTSSYSCTNMQQPAESSNQEFYMACCYPLKKPWKIMSNVALKYSIHHVEHCFQVGF